ncbi:MAG: flagellar biosynthesis anti-sigma factor FlgM [Butyrivibrio sp.]|nr:flagellar biosynthesis anti-sigma factor FlgM [Butyrivibrio sp.]
MRIDAYNQVSRIYQTKNKPAVTKKGAAKGADKVEISQFGRDYQVAKQAVAAASDVREDKVADMKARIEAGTYDVSADDFAAKLAEKYGTTVF